MKQNLEVKTRKIEIEVKDLSVQTRTDARSKRLNPLNRSAVDGNDGSD